MAHPPGLSVMSGRAGGTEMRFASGSQCQSFWIMLLLVFGKLDNGNPRLAADYRNS